MKIKSKETLWEGRYLRTVLIRWLDPEGVERTWEAVERPGIDGIVLIVPVKTDGKLVLIRQFRPAVGREVYELPAGLNDRSETSSDCARRELLEETGYRAGGMKPLMTCPSGPASTSSILDVFLATDLHMVGRTGGDDNEFIENVEVSMDAAVDFLLERTREGHYVDIKIFGLVEAARREMAAEDA